MTSSYMSTMQIPSSKFCTKINRFSSAKNFHYSGSYIYPSFRLERSHSNHKALKYQTRASKSGPDKEEKEEVHENGYKPQESDREDYRAEESDREDYRAEEADREDDRAEEADREGRRAEEANREGHLAEEAVLKLYSDIKDRNIIGISEVIGDECQCFCNFLSTYRLLQGKKQVMAFFYWLMMKLGKDIKIIVKPTSNDGLTVSVEWQLQWEKPHIQLGKGFSFHIFHIYQGKLLIKNVEMFMEPIFHIEPLRLRAMAFAVSLAEKIVTYLRSKENTRRQTLTVLLFALLLLAAVAFYFTNPRF